MKKINLILIIILVIVVDYIAADLFWLVVKPDATNILNTSLNKKELINLQLADNIFGSKYKSKPKKTIKEIKQSKLSLDLIGILFKRHNPLAIIAPEGKPALAKNYKVGDHVKTRIMISEIGRDFVFLKRNGKLEKLTFKKTKKDNNIINKTNKVKKSTLSAQQKNKINDYRIEIINNPQKLLSVVSVLPFFKNGKMIGVKVKPNKDKQTFSALGFESGDIITKINKIYINNFNKFVKIRQIIYSSSSFDLKIKRDNKTVYLFIQL